MKRINVHSLDETKKLGFRLAELVEPGMLITLSGDLGAGKTTFTKFLGAGLGIKKTINSPTFTILKSYHGRIPMHHIDAYRLEGITQDLGFEEVFEDDGVCVVEWANFIEEQLPKERLEIEIQRGDDEQRIFTFHGVGEVYEQIVRDL